MASAKIIRTIDTIQAPVPVFYGNKVFIVVI